MSICILPRSDGEDKVRPDRINANNRHFVEVILGRREPRWRLEGVALDDLSLDDEDPYLVLVANAQAGLGPIQHRCRDLLLNA